MHELWVLLAFQSMNISKRRRHWLGFRPALLCCLIVCLLICLFDCLICCLTARLFFLSLPCSRQSGDSLLDLLGGGDVVQPTQPEPTPTPAPAKPASAGGELLDLLGGLDMGPTGPGEGAARPAFQNVLLIFSVRTIEEPEEGSCQLQPFLWPFTVHKTSILR